MGPQGPKEKDIPVETHLFEHMNFGMTRVLLVRTFGTHMRMLSMPSRRIGWFENG